VLRAVEQEVATTALVRSPRWPRRPLTGVLLLVGLFALCIAPVALAEGRAPFLVMALPSALAAAWVARLMFELMASDASVVAAAASAATASVAFVVLGTLVVGTGAPLEWYAPTWLGLTALLYTGARLRSRELERPTGHQQLWYIGDPAGATALTRECASHGQLRVVGSSLVGEFDTDTRHLRTQILQAGATTLVLSADALAQPELVQLATDLNLRGIRVRSLLAFIEEESGRVLLQELAPAWFLFDVAEIHRAELYGGAKRAGELAFSATMLAVSVPLLVLISVAVKLTSPGPIFYRQKRIGLAGQPFVLTKLRTMVWNPDQVSEDWATSRTAHITAVGRMIRRFRLDELPQLWHVVRGHLSLVGPRPEQPEIVARLEREIPYYHVRHCVRPGLTGWAQVNYRYGGSVEEAAGKLEYELYYIKNQSLRLDVRIMSATVRTVLSGSGR
jgi:lipopolysaccharide/colanic/teichoic acid biosynthesis glycosyltransferase